MTGRVDFRKFLGSAFTYSRTSLSSCVIVDTRRSQSYSRTIRDFKGRSETKLCLSFENLFLYREIASQLSYSVEALI